MYSFIIEPGSYYVAQAGFEPLGSGYPAMSGSQTAVTAGRCIALGLVRAFFFLIIIFLLHLSDRIV